MEITLSKSRLRPFQTSDAKSLAYYANNPKIAENLRDSFPYPYNLGDANNFIGSIASNPMNLILAIEINGKVSGVVGIHRQEDVYMKNAELGYWLGEPFWGQGIVTEAVNAIVKYTFEHLPILRIYSKVFEHNVASMRVMEKCGFIREAVLKKAVIKNGVLMDEIIFARVIA